MRISAPSFIKPASRVENVRFLKTLVDEVELLYMSSLENYDQPDVLEVKQLSETDMRYNIHMPYDRDLTKFSEWEFMAEFADKLKPLNAVTHTFHIIESAGFFKGLEWFIDETELPVTLENGDDYLGDFDLPNDAKICLDVGHMFMHGQNIERVLSKQANHIEMFHIHGVIDGRDHKSIRYLPKDIRDLIFSFAKDRGKTVSLEVFNEADLMDSLSIFSQWQ